jgi:signal-transduction protein with cAMP-binding, CBS, and nucleotidyltransferase domain
MRRLQRTIEEIGWTREVPRLAFTERVVKAFDLMSKEAHDCVLVMEGDRLAGIFTSRDFLNRVAGERGDPATLTLGSVMTATPRTLRPRDPVAFAINWMAVEGFRNVPIVDDTGHILGVLTIWDVMRQLGELFAEIDATPRSRLPHSDTSSVVSMIDLGGDQ